MKRLIMIISLILFTSLVYAEDNYSKICTYITRAFYIGYIDGAQNNAPGTSIKNTLAIKPKTEAQYRSKKYLLAGYVDGWKAGNKYGILRQDIIDTLLVKYYKECKLIIFKHYHNID